jgi:hypothetical protein
LLLHLLFILVAGGCLLAGWWQVHRAMAGNALSYGYSVEWPAFAVVAGIGWWQMVHDTPEEIAERRAARARARAASAEVASRYVSPEALAITVGSQDVVNRQLPAGADAQASGAQLVRTDRSDLTVRGADGDEVDTRTVNAEAPADDMTAYNQYLAVLAARGRSKTWRNPHGV